jgi:predicted HTH transcriptional regulator
LRSEKVEFKSTLRTNLHTGAFDEKIHMAALKTIAAFLNTDGGTLLIGVADDGSIRGLSGDRFENEDKMALHLVSLIRERIGDLFFPHVRIDFVTHDGGRVLLVDCERGAKPAFVKEGKVEKFYTRAGNASIELSASSMVGYCSSRFK